MLPVAITKNKVVGAFKLKLKVFDPIDDLFNSGNRVGLHNYTKKSKWIGKKERIFKPIT